MVPGETAIFNREGVQVAIVEDGVVRMRKLTVVRDFRTAVEASTGVKPVMRRSPRPALARTARYEFASRFQVAKGPHRPS